MSAGDFEQSDARQVVLALPVPLPMPLPLQQSGCPIFLTELESFT